MTPEEASQNYAMMSLPFTESVISDDEIFHPPETPVPDSVNWYAKGVVTPVKHQGKCSSCWAFSAIGSLEGMHALKTGKLVALSEQNLLDCVKRNGCAGGFAAEAFEYIKDNGGVDTEKSYPYQAVNTTCRFNRRTIGATVRSWKHIAKNRESDLQKAVGTVGPVSRRGIYSGQGCNTATSRHAMVVVGYGSTQDLGAYWWIKNSWGRNWGRDGYVFIKRNAGVCGIASRAVYPVV